MTSTCHFLDSRIRQKSRAASDIMCLQVSINSCNNPRR
nr:MAG TPA: hypothetical protein [Caudoviricetes sp.]